MTAMANPDVIMRSEFESTMERLGLRLTALETARTVQINEAGKPTVGGQFEVVTQNEFRLFKWFGAFALAVVVGGFGVLYEQNTYVRVEMRNLHTEVLRELHAQIGGLRQEMKDEIGGLRQEMKDEIGGLRLDIGSLRERVARVETLLVGDESGAET